MILRRHRNRYVTNRAGDVAASGEGPRAETGLDGQDPQVARLGKPEAREAVSDDAQAEKRPASRARKQAADEQAADEQAGGDAEVVFTPDDAKEE